ncbi:MAG: four helix bundle protein [Ignavibacteria bacterium]|nr:four helix bundle protein [Ignavibacteria bacterium]MBK7032662.1 four helix bundle protein [Ignavibacteria bacterium]MBK7185922.1 four helix bundle protein [Ignavibacteria bacterium]MBK7575902.1 four helix bundle protein [Ignavibacteria bacterium]MBK9182648.1 four helix bundle protein [Ignavibacteria bacterium]
MLEVARLIRLRQDYRLSSQIVGAALGIANNIAESHGAQSRADFISKLKIAHKELLELEALSIHFNSNNGVKNLRLETMYDLMEEVGKLLTASISTAIRNRKSSN